MRLLIVEDDDALGQGLRSHPVGTPYLRSFINRQ